MEGDIICDDRIRPAPKPTISGELCLCFEYDFPIENVSNMLGVQATSSARQADLRTNPLTGKKNPGYWEYVTPRIQDYDCNGIMDMLHDFISLHKKQLLQVKQTYPCDVIIRIYIWAYEDADCPVILFKEPIIADAMLLNAELDVVVEK